MSRSLQTPRRVTVPSPPPRAALTKAPPAVIRQHKARRTDALEAAGGVGACPEEADVGLLFTLVDIWKHQDTEQPRVIPFLVTLKPAEAATSGEL